MLLKKILEKKGTLILMIISTTLGLLLCSLIFTIGLNITSRINSTSNKVFYSNVYVSDSNNNVLDFNLKGIPGVEKVSQYLKFDQKAIRLNDVEIDSDVYVMNANNDSLLPGSGLLYGKDILSTEEILISEAMLSSLSISKEEALKSKITLSNDACYIVCGIFASDDIYASYDYIISDDLKGNTYILRTSDLSTTLEEIDKLNYTVYSYLNEIRSLNSYLAIIKVVFIFIGILVMLVSSVILYTSLKARIRDKYTFIAMLKAQGYTNIKASKIVFMEIVLIDIISLVLSLIIMITVSSIFDGNLDLSVFIKDIDGIDTLRFNLTAVIYMLISLIIISFIIAYRSYTLIKRSNVYEILQGEIYE